MDDNHNNIQNNNNDNKNRHHNKPKHILLGITGSVAAIKGPELALSIAKSLQAKVIVILTHGGTNFWYKSNEYNNGLKWKEYCTFVANNHRNKQKEAISDNINNSDVQEKSVFQMLGEEDDESTTCCSYDDFKGDIAICHAQDEWNKWNKIGDPVLHIQLRDWADCIIIAPLTAHTLGKIANGLCDDTLSCILRAWNYGHNGHMGQDIIDTSTSTACHSYITTTSSSGGRKPIILAPAMNTAMWEHPITKQQLSTLQSFWYGGDGNDHLTFIVEPQVKVLACGDVGTGAMANVDDIVHRLKLSIINYRY